MKMSEITLKKLKLTMMDLIVEMRKI